MMRMDELTTGKTFLPADTQSATIQKYCAGIENRILSATSESEAGNIAVQACLSFEQECVSDIVKESLKRYVRELVEKQWKR